MVKARKPPMAIKSTNKETTSYRNITEYLVLLMTMVFTKGQTNSSLENILLIKRSEDDHMYSKKS